MLGLGDSTIAGVGVEDSLLGLTAQFSRELYRLTLRGVTWDSYGERGITAPTLHRDYLKVALSQSAPIDVALVSIGANDAKGLHSATRAVESMTRIVGELREHSPRAVVLVSSLPAFHLFDSLPQPLRWVMSSHAGAIERRARPLVEANPRVIMSPPPSHYPPGFFASDGFHPSAEGYGIWASFALQDAVGRGVIAHLLDD